MLNIGLIGNISSIETQVEKLKKYPDVRVQGKSSVGTKTHHSEYSFTIPEYNRIELIERSDAIILEDSSLVPYSLIKDSIKRSKHVFFSDYPDYNEDQCNELIKLVEESGTIVQVKNPLYYNSNAQFIVRNVSAPFYLRFEIQKPPSEIKGNIIWDIILFVIKLGQYLPKKVKTFHSGHRENLYNFTNIRLEYSDSSILELNLNFTEDNEKFHLTLVSENNYFDFDFETNQLATRSVPVNTQNPEFVMEYESFFKSIIKKQTPITGINEYVVALKTVKEINSKINLASL